VTRTAVVTGAGAGIGAATARRLTHDGWDVVPVDRAWPGGAPSRALTVDLADVAAVERALGGVERVDALVCAAGTMIAAPLEATTAAAWDALHAVNARAPFVCLRAVLPQLRASRGVVVNVASVHAVATSAPVAAYAASKGALTAFTRAAAVELAPDGVRVNAVLPGAVDTAMLRAGLERGDDPEGARGRLVERTPLGRVGRPEEIAHAIAFLLGERAAFVTGEALAVDGGALARLGTE